MSGVMSKRRYIRLAYVRQVEKDPYSPRSWPSAKAFTLPQRERVQLPADAKPQHGVSQAMPARKRGESGRRCCLSPHPAPACSACPCSSTASPTSS